MTSHFTSDIPTPVRDASSVMLLRDSHHGIEVFTLTRVSTMPFAAGATVFPGGGFEPGDDLLARSWRGLEVDRRARDGLLGDDECAWRRLIVTAIRETFEETGVLLGAAHQENLAPSPQVREEARRAVERQELDLRAIYSDYAAGPKLSALVPVARWITPEGRPRRYDTRFFAARAPRGQEPLHIPGEARSAQWMTPRQVLRKGERKELNLMRPTRALLGSLNCFDSVNHALASAPFESAVRPP